MAGPRRASQGAEGALREHALGGSPVWCILGLQEEGSVLDRWTMRHVHVARGTAWLVASCLVATACSSGGPLENTSFGFDTPMTTGQDPTAGSVGTFEPEDTTMGVETTGSVDDTTDGGSLGSTSSEGSTTTGGPLCGDGSVDAEEECDGVELGGQDCASQGFDAGTLACADDCTLDTSGCTMFACGNGVIEGTEVCDGADLGGQGCATQGFDAGTLACAAGCSAFDTTGCSFACAEQNLGSSVGSPVASGSTVGEDEDLLQSCGSSGAVDFVLQFTAPAAATFQFDTVGSSYDTVLSLHATCGGAAVACNDDFSDLQSQVTYPMVAGQAVLIAVSGFSGSTGSWVLNIVQL